MQIGIIGCGNMGSALARRLSKEHSLFLYDHRPEKIQKLEAEGLGKATASLQEVLHLSEAVILAVKPQSLEQLVAQMTDPISSDLSIVSLLAGVSISTLRTYFPKQFLMRMMPNIAVAYGEGVVGLTADPTMPQNKKKQLSEAFKNLGQVHWIAEEKMNALTSLTGSGPAFCFAIIEAMIEAGIVMGFPAPLAKELVYQTLQGSLSLLIHTGKHPEELKWEVASPKGTTIAGLKKLEESDLRGAIINTFLAAYARGNELSLEKRGEKA